MSFARMVRGIRKYSGVTQVELSNLLAITQGTVSKVENGILNPDVNAWLKFCKTFDNSPFCHTNDYIDGDFIKKNSDSFIYKMKTTFLSGPCFTVRSILPLIFLFNTKKGERQFDAFVKQKGIDRDYLTIRDNKLNLRFFVQMLKELEVENENLDSLYTDCASFNNLELIHGDIASRYNKSDPIKRILAFLKNAKYYDNFSKHEHILEQDGTVLEVRKLIQADLSEVSADKQHLLKTLGSYFRSYVKGLIGSISSDHTRLVDSSFEVLTDNELRFVFKFEQKR
ncbi:MAG: helix-turn-helix transcriptional regulator [Bacteriovoracaceae bacterium]|nr:helix-turn-helix transcriptional regulator [Bacteriovoracaceae bacterium]